MINRIIEANPLTWLGNWLFSKSSLLSKLTQYFSQLLIGSTATNTRNALFLLGVAGISYLTLKSIYNQYKFWSFVPKHQRNAKEFSTEAYKQRYGDCYVLITGAADGIGYAYSREFCRMGFNIIMADIQEQKLAFKKDELKAVYPNCRIQTYVVNMSEQKAIDSFIENIKNYDIGIVVNNVGVSGGGAYL